jgi:periplasmic glucans biosynthesis protein
VENNLRHNPETKGWRLTLRLKVKDPSKSTELRALVADEEPAPAAPLTKAEKAAAKAQEKKEQHKAKDAKAPAPKRPSHTSASQD